MFGRTLKKLHFEGGNVTLQESNQGKGQGHVQLRSPYIKLRPKLYPPYNNCALLTLRLRPPYSVAPSLHCALLTILLSLLAPSLQLCPPYLNFWINVDQGRFSMICRIYVVKDVFIVFHSIILSPDFLISFSKLRPCQKGVTVAKTILKIFKVSKRPYKNVLEMCRTPVCYIYRFQIRLVGILDAILDFFIQGVPWSFWSKF